MAALVLLLAGATLVGTSSSLTSSISPRVQLSKKFQAKIRAARAARMGWHAGLRSGRIAHARPRAAGPQGPIAAVDPGPPSPTDPEGNFAGNLRPNPSPPSEPPAPDPEPVPEPEPPDPNPAPEPGPQPEPAPAPDPTPAPQPEPPPLLPPPPLIPPPTVDPPVVVPAEEPILEAGFENGLKGWSTSGVGDVVPKVVTDIVRDGDKSSAILLTGSQDRSELSLGGNGTASTAGSIHFHEGDERYFAFSFYIQSMVYGEPGAHNLIMQFKSDGTGSPNFGLQLWDYEGDDGKSGGKGLWSHGSAMGGDRFLSPVAERQWHDVVIHFKASGEGDGFYRVHLNGDLIDSRDNVSMIRADRSYAYIKDGLYRNGDTAPGTSEIRLDAAKLGETLESVQP